MSRRIAVIQGNPDSGGSHFGHALAQAYIDGAKAAGHETRIIDVGEIDFPLLRSKEDFERGTAPVSIRAAQKTIGWADHLVIIYPLWLGMMPAVLKAFLEQVFRPGFAFANPENGKGMPKKLLAEKSARVVITMGMPAFFYRWIFGAHGAKALKRSVLGFCGVHPVKQTYIGMIESTDTGVREKWLDKLRVFGRHGQ